MEAQSPKGTKDMLPGDSGTWQWIEATMREETALAGYREIRTPVFEHTELFQRGVGDTTDIVQKEMYTFLDKGGRSITLKPEGTAGVVRALVENNLYAQPLPCKLYYLNNPVFRYENPQHGRLREHHQFGMECFGSKEPTADAEVIVTILKILNSLGLAKLAVKINSIGCPVCRPNYHQKLMEYLNVNVGRLCSLCKDRMQRNPLRVFDCKESGCKSVADSAPSILENLCEECEAHFGALKALLSGQGIDYQIDSRIVRGLDYYTKTVFEIIMRSQQGEMALCGGGRYDGLVEEIGGPSLPGVGFGIGTERILLELENQGITRPPELKDSVFVASVGEEARQPAFLLCMQLRGNGIKSDCDHMLRSLKAQFRYADKAGFRLILIIGGDELNRGIVKLKDMTDGSEQELSLASVVSAVKASLLSTIIK